MIANRYACEITREDVIKAGCDGAMYCWKCMKRAVSEPYDLCKYCDRKPTDQKGGQLPLTQWSLEQLIETQKRGDTPGREQRRSHERLLSAYEVYLVETGYLSSGGAWTSVSVACAERDLTLGG